MLCSIVELKVLGENFSKTLMETYGWEVLYVFIYSQLCSTGARSPQSSHLTQDMHTRVNYWLESYNSRPTSSVYAKLYSQHKVFRPGIHQNVLLMGDLIPAPILIGCFTMQVQHLSLDYSWVKCNSISDSQRVCCQLVVSSSRGTCQKNICCFSSCVPIDFKVRLTEEFLGLEEFPVSLWSRMSCRLNFHTFIHNYWFLRHIWIFSLICLFCYCGGMSSWPNLADDSVNSKGTHT